MHNTNTKITKIPAFTLAETLITLMIIGVVAAFVIPSFINNINSLLLTRQKKIIEQKITEGFRRMQGAGDLEEIYSTTEDFVSKMKKYFVIDKICTRENLSDCFTANIFHTDGNVYNTSELTNTKKIDGNKNYDSNVISLLLNDGTNLLVTYDYNCDDIKIEEKDKIDNITKCFGLIFDINGNKSPNTVSKDIITSNIQFDGFLFKVGNLKLVEVESATTFNTLSPTSYQEERNLMSKYGVNNTAYKYPDMWFGAVRYCQDKGLRLPTRNEMVAISNEAYTNNNEELLALLQDSIFWSFDDRPGYAWVYHFRSKSAGGLRTVSYGRDGATWTKAICVK